MGLHLWKYLLHRDSTFTPLCECVCVCECVRSNEKLSELVWEKGEWLWQADGLSHCLLRSSTSQPITPVSSYQCVVYHSLHSNICTLPFFLSVFRFAGARSHLFMAVWLVGGMSSVRCNPIWVIRCSMCVGVKPVKWCPSLPPFLQHPCLLPGGCLHR